MSMNTENKQYSYSVCKYGSVFTDSLEPAQPCANHPRAWSRGYTRQCPRGCVGSLLSDSDILAVQITLWLGPGTHARGCVGTLALSDITPPLSRAGNVTPLALETAPASRPIAPDRCVMDAG
eukprot:6943631-Prymnesium_polylepis.1